MNAGFCRSRIGAVFLGALAAAGCQDAGPVGWGGELPLTVARYEIVAGEGQSAPAGSELPAPLVVRVTDATGAARQGQIVNWIVTGGGGDVFAGVALTDSLGFAREWWTLGPEPGANTLEARAVDSSTGEALVFARFAATGTDGAVSEAPAPPAESISIAGTAYKVKGLQKVDLAWSGAEGTSVRILRDGATLLTTRNDGAHVDAIDRRGGGSYRYRVCEVDGTRCSGELQLGF